MIPKTTLGARLWRVRLHARRDHATLLQATPPIHAAPPSHDFVSVRWEMSMPLHVTSFHGGEAAAMLSALPPNDATPSRCPRGVPRGWSRAPSPCPRRHTRAPRARAEQATQCGRWGAHGRVPPLRRHHGKRRRWQKSSSMIARCPVFHAAQSRKAIAVSASTDMVWPP